MAAESTMLSLGTTAPDFDLLSPVWGNTVALSSFTEKALVVMFIAVHCPYVQHVRDGLVSLAQDYTDRDVAFVAISSNDAAAYPGDAPEAMAAAAAEFGYPFTYLFDETQEVAKAYTAACTPDFFLFGADRGLVYRGRMDSSRPSSGVPVTGEDLRVAIDAVLADEDQPEPQYPSMGCSIKWKQGNAPAYQS